MKIFFNILVIFFVNFLHPLALNPAEILQINDSNTVLIGDLNRNLTVNLFCINVLDNKEKMAVEILKKNFPRGTKVKIKPFGLIDGKLQAKIYKLNDEIEMSQLLKNMNSSQNIELCK